jgi:hypothetical protein
LLSRQGEIMLSRPGTRWFPKRAELRRSHDERNRQAAETERRLAYFERRDGLQDKLLMQDVLGRAQSRRGLIKAAVVAGSVFVVPGCARRIAPVASVPAPPVPAPAAPAAAVKVAARPATPLGVREALFRRALAAQDRHDGRVARRDRIAIADFAAPSSAPRFHVINVEDGSTLSLLVSHGKGSDPGHTGYLQRFSNVNGSEASCEGSFVTTDY